MPGDGVGVVEQACAASLRAGSVSLTGYTDNAGAAIRQAQDLPGSVIELHDKTKDVNDAEYMVEHQHRWSEPSDDRNEVLFARLQTTKESLTLLYDDKVTEGIHAYLDHIIGAAQDAKKLL